MFVESDEKWVRKSHRHWEKCGEGVALKDVCLLWKQLTIRIKFKCWTRWTEQEEENGWKESPMLYSVFIWFRLDIFRYWNRINPLYVRIYLATSFILQVKVSKEYYNEIADAVKSRRSRRKMKQWWGEVNRKSTGDKTTGEKWKKGKTVSRGG